ncbi:MAG: hypothetical protein CSYNP_04250 [Syntrophus sp. SKADARSKE-3]|nr:hypothetical protein [Syntrophus sp. SKADARSKE-3]
MKRYFEISLVIILFCIAAGAFADEKTGRPSCEICGMYIDQFHDTSTHLTSKNGEIKKTCGVACMLRIVNDKGGPAAFTKIEVHDWKNKTLIPAADAVYVIGSKRIPDMTPNIIAFEKKEDAEAFRAKEGGMIYGNRIKSSQK